MPAPAPESPRIGAADVAAVHGNSRTVLGIDQITDVAALLLRKRATLEVEVTVVVEVNELQIASTLASHNGTLDISLIPFKSFGCTRFRLRPDSGYVVG